MSDGATLTVCRGDVNCDGSVDSLDYDEFVDPFEGGSPRADFDRDGVIDLFDDDSFALAFETAC